MKAPFSRAMLTAFFTAGITDGPPRTNREPSGSRKSFCTQKLQNRNISNIKSESYLSIPSYK